MQRMIRSVPGNNIWLNICSKPIGSPLVYSICCSVGWLFEQSDTDLKVSRVFSSWLYSDLKDGFFNLRLNRYFGLWLTLRRLGTCWNPVLNVVRLKVVSHSPHFVRKKAICWTCLLHRCCYQLSKERGLEATMDTSPWYHQIQLHGPSLRGETHNCLLSAFEKELSNWKSINHVRQQGFLSNSSSANLLHANTGLC